MKLFKDRTEAGKRLGESLAEYAGRTDVVVLGLPRGGVPVAFEVSKALRAPLDIFLVRKLGVPGDEELAMGAIASGGIRVLNEGVIRSLGISERELAAVAAREMRELDRREIAYRGDRPRRCLSGKTVIIVDDGIATGASMRAAIAALRAQKTARTVIAVPVASADTCAYFESVGEEVVCLATPEPFIAIGPWYEDFSQTTDDEVRELLVRAAAPPASSQGPRRPAPRRYRPAG
jgi:putative phosphoribosyl transferase